MNETINIEKNETSLELRLDYIDKIELSFDPVITQQSDFIKTPKAEPETGKPQAFVNGSSITSFVADVSAKGRSDVLNTFLLAQLAADKAVGGVAKKGENTSAWYSKYCEVLGMIGWVMQEFKFIKYTSSSEKFTIDKVVLEILAGIASENSISIAKAANEAINALPKGSDAVSIFQHSSSESTNSCFQVAPAVEKNNALSVSLGGFSTHSRHSSTDVLFFFHSECAESDLFYSAQTVTLNSDVFNDDLRKTVIKKLGDNARKYINNIDI